jgi:hypothetical protein
MIEIIRILKAQLPTMSPTARSGASRKTTALIPFINSGIEVTDAKRMIPTNIFPQPRISAIIFPYLESREPVATITAVAITNPIISRYKVFILEIIISLMTFNLF